jgi:hypothetical protein
MTHRAAALRLFAFLPTLAVPFRAPAGQEKKPLLQSANLYTAMAAELQRVPGAGPKTATQIVKALRTAPKKPVTAAAISAGKSSGAAAPGTRRNQARFRNDAWISPLRDSKKRRFTGRNHFIGKPASASALEKLVGKFRRLQRQGHLLGNGNAIAF